MLAVQEGKDDLAKQALMRYNEALQGAQQLHETWLKHRAETEKLKLSLRPLNDKIEEAKRKKNILWRARTPRRGAAAHPGDDVGDVRQVRLRVVRADDREDRERRSGRPSPPPSCRRSSRATRSPSSSRRSSTRASADQAAARAQAADGRAAPGPRREGEAAGQRRATCTTPSWWTIAARPTGRRTGDSRESWDERVPSRSPSLLGRTDWPSDISDLSIRLAPVTSHRPQTNAQPRFLIVADGDFWPMTSKTANSVIRYRPQQVVGVLDRQLAGTHVAGRARVRRHHPGASHR